MRESVVALAHHVPLSNLSVLGKYLAEYWIEHLHARGAREIQVLVADRPNHVREVLSDGARWGLKVTIHPEEQELTREDALKKYRRGEGWMNTPDDAHLMDHFPGMPKFPLFDNYGAFIAAQHALIPRAASPDRIGLHETAPGVWLGWHARIAPSAKLVAPCWIGDEVVIGEEATVGPGAVVEKRSVIQRGAEVSNCVLGPDTLVGEHVTIRHSIASGDVLINCKLNSFIQVRAPFLLSSLAKNHVAARPEGLFNRLAATCASTLTFPLTRAGSANGASTHSGPVSEPVSAEKTAALNEFLDFRNWLGYWPQLRSLMFGKMAWAGHHSATSTQAMHLRANERHEEPFPRPRLNHAEGNAVGSARLATAAWRPDHSAVIQICKEDEGLVVLGIRDLNSRNMQILRKTISQAAQAGLSYIGIDLRQVAFLDGPALGALVSLHRATNQCQQCRTLVVRLLNLQPAVEQMLELTRMNELFEITLSETSAAIPGKLVPTAAQAA